MSILLANKLAKTYKQRTVVKDVSLQVQSGEVVGLLGANGAGKTTSFYMIVGLIKCDAGEIFLDEQNITKLPMHRRAQLGISYLPQDPSIFRKLSVEDNILAVLEAQRFSRTMREERLEQLLSELHIGHIRNHLGLSVSGGERRRVEVARALATQPRFILLDEPFVGIDPLTLSDIQQLIKHLCSLEIGVLITDHNVRETLGICNRAYIVNEGNIIAEGTPENILNNQQVRNVYLGQHFSL